MPAKYRRQRSRLLDAMLDGHFHTGGIKVAMAAEPDLLLAVGSLLHEMGQNCAAASAPPSRQRTRCCQLRS